MKVLQFFCAPSLFLQHYVICFIKPSLTVIVTQTSPFWSYVRCRGAVAQPVQCGAQPAGEKDLETYSDMPVTEIMYWIL